MVGDDFIDDVTKGDRKKLVGDGNFLWSGIGTARKWDLVSWKKYTPPRLLEV
jgi:hypothetical protein